MGDWKDQYDALLKQVQAALGQPATGLQLDASPN
jgi:hypothetical protein